MEGIVCFFTFFLVITTGDVIAFARTRKETILLRMEQQKANDLKEREIELYSQAIKSQLIRMGIDDNV